GPGALWSGAHHRAAPPPRLHDTVGRLGRQPDAQQEPEPAIGENLPQVDAAHPPRLGRRALGVPGSEPWSHPGSTRATRQGPGGHSPRMKASTASRASSSLYCTGGDFMKYDEADSSGPATPGSLAIFAARIASMMTPAELGESHTSSLYSSERGTSPKLRPSSRTNAHLRSSSHAT